MANYAIHDGSSVINVIVADTKAIAEEATGMSAIKTTGSPWIGWTMEDEGWRPPTPFASWIWDGSAWVAPIAHPTDGGNFYWDEGQGGWVELIIPEPVPDPVAE